MVLEKGIAKGKIGFREKGAQFKNFQALSQVYEAAINRVRPLIPYSLRDSDREMPFSVLLLEDTGD